jgi:hypothetical protein
MSPISAIDRSPGVGRFATEAELQKQTHQLALQSGRYFSWFLLLVLIGSLLLLCCLVVFLLFYCVLFNVS